MSITPEILERLRGHANTLEGNNMPGLAVDIRALLDAATPKPAPLSERIAAVREEFKDAWLPTPTPAPSSGEVAAAGR